MADSKFCTGCQRSNEDIKAVSWCSNCSERVCKACARVHERMSPPHKVVPMNELQQPSDSLLNLSIKNCENHLDQKVVRYCCQHDKMICDSCVPISHQNCQPIISIEKAARGVKDGTAIFDLERRMDNLSQVIEKILSRAETTLEDLKNSRNKIKKRVSEIKQKVVAHSDKLEADIHKDIESKYKQCNEKVSKNKASIQSSSKSLFTWKNNLRLLKQHASEIHVFKAVKLLDTRAHKKELEIREIQKDTVPTLTYHPSESELNIKKILSDLGTINIENVHVPVPALYIYQQGQFLVRRQSKLSLAHSFETTNLIDGLQASSGCLIPGNRLLLSHNYTNKLFVCNIDGSNLNAIDLDYSPRRITLYDHSHVVVSTGYDGIQIIELTSLNPGTKIKINGKCKGITSAKDKIWIHNQSNTLTIVDIRGIVMRTVKSTFNPWVICANQDGDVYCTDSDSDKVYVITSDGIEREIYSNADLEGAGGIAVDDRGDVFIAGYKSNNIHKISKDGKKHSIVLAADDGISQPDSLSFNYETRALLVVYNSYKSINIYKT